MGTTIKISDFDYKLPDERIAKFPLPERDSSKLLVFKNGTISETIFRNLGDALPKGAMLVFNNTKVIRARLLMNKPTGARIEIFCLEPHNPADYERSLSSQGTCQWLCIVGNLKKWKEGPLEVRFECEGREYGLKAWNVGRQGQECIVKFEWDAPMAFGQLLEHLGRIPIPPYLNRESEDIDNTRYQTVYSKFEGSVAAPTAGLHFTPSLIDKLDREGFGFGEITLHVGAGTFLPVKDDDAEKHQMHTEHFEVDIETIKKIIENFGNIIPVGTTSVRTLESLTVLGYRTMMTGRPDPEKTIAQWEAYDIPPDLSGKELLEALAGYMDRTGASQLDASTQIMIKPGYIYRLTSGMITNFHQPKSTLLLLVSAFIGEEWRRVYDHALSNGFRFLSYGDSSLLMGSSPQGPKACGTDPVQCVGAK